MTHTIHVRQDNEAAMRAYASRMPEVDREMGKYSWVKSLDGLPIIAKLAIGLIAYPIAYLHDWCHHHSIRQHTLEEAGKATMQQLQLDHHAYSSINPQSELDLGFLEKTTSRYRAHLKEEAKQFLKKQFPFPCVLKPIISWNKDEVDTAARTVKITHDYEIYYEDIRIGTLTVTSDDRFSAEEAQGNTTYTVYSDPSCIVEALEHHHLSIFKDYLFSSFELDLNRLTIETRHSEVHSSKTHLNIRKKYRVLYDGLSMGTISFTGDYEIRHGKVQGGMKHHYDLLTKTFKKRKRAKVSI